MACLAAQVRTDLCLSDTQPLTLCHSAGGRFGGKKKASVELQCGGCAVATRELSSGSAALFYEELELSLRLPADWAQVPDVFVNLLIGGKRVSYLRFGTGWAQSLSLSLSLSLFRS